MMAGIQLINLGQQLFLTAKWVEVDDQGLGRFIQLSWSVEELPPQGSHVLADMVWSQRRGQVGHRVVHQGHQPADHLQRATMEARPLPIRAVLVITAGHGIDQQVVHLHAMALLMVLAGPEDRQVNSDN